MVAWRKGAVVDLRDSFLRISKRVPMRALPEGCVVVSLYAERNPAWWSLPRLEVGQ